MRKFSQTHRRRVIAFTSDLHCTYLSVLPCFGYEILFYSALMNGCIQLTDQEGYLSGFIVAFQRGVSV